MKNISKELREWIVIIAVFGTLYLTGWHVEVLGFFQRGIVASGLLKPEVIEDQLTTSYELKLMDTNGDVFSLADWKGRTIFINVWATWCPPCVAEMPDIHDLYSKVKEDVVFIMISRDQDEAKAKAWIEKKGYEFPIYFARSRFPPELASQAIPTTIVIAPDGSIMVKNSGMAKYDTTDFREMLTSL